MADINPKQQAQELIKQAHHVLIVSGDHLNDDQFCAMLAMKDILTKIGKSATVVSSRNLPKVKQCFDHTAIISSFDGARDLIVDIDTTDALIDTVKYDSLEGKLRITVRPKEGALNANAIKSYYGAYLFDLVIVLGVSDFTNVDRFVTKDSSVFDGIHLINIDYHRINSGFGSVNIVDTNASSVCEMIIALSESLGYGPIGTEMASILFAGIVANTNRFANNNTTAKAMTMAAQMLAAGARHNEIIKVLSDINSSSSPSDKSKGNHQAPGSSNAKPHSAQNSIQNDSSKLKPVLEVTTETADDQIKAKSSKTATEKPRQRNTNKLVARMSASKNHANGMNNLEPLNMDNTGQVITLEQEINQYKPVSPTNVSSSNVASVTSVGLDIDGSDLDQYLSLKTK